MRLALDPRAGRLLRRVPRPGPYTILELVLLSLLAMQCARLAWTVVTPVGPIGDWKTLSARPAAPAGVLGSFDPFFRLNPQAGPVVVTSLNLQLFGIRQDAASGRGSAIIATPDGVQRSFAVGEEIVPGVTLTGVAFDSVTISRGGATEQLYMDQSPEAKVVGAAPAKPSKMELRPPVEAPPPGAPPSVTPPPVVRVPAPPPAPARDLLTAMGLAPGDVVTSVNGRRVGSADEARALAREMAGRTVVVQVQRNGRLVTLRGRGGQ